MITLWGIWMDGEWLRRDEEDGCCLYLYARREDAHNEWAAYAEVREYGQFIQAPPQEVVEAVKAIGGGPVVVVQPHQESVHRILNWIAQAVVEQRNEA